MTVDHDPVTEMYQAQGRFYYFHPDEVEPLPGGESASPELPGPAAGSGPAAM